MFQYACGRALALRNETELVLDSRDFVAGPGQKPGLHHLNIVSDTGTARGWPPKKKQRIAYLIWRTLKLPPRIVRQKGDGFVPSIVRETGSLWLQGYWQSERFFEDFADQIRIELSVKTEPDDTNRAILAQLENTPAVSLHIRRGDYVSNPKANAVHGTCSLEYYKKAAMLVAEKMPVEPVFYVFSDEPEWAKSNLALPFEVKIMDHNDGAHNYEDLRLMSACQHHIIANSSFSWWGAWLNASREKVVVAPAVWFADKSVSNPDIIPESWVRLEG